MLIAQLGRADDRHRRARARLRVGRELAPGADRAAARGLPAEAREEADRDQHRRARHLGPATAATSRSTRRLYDSHIAFVQAVGRRGAAHEERGGLVLPLLHRRLPPGVQRPRELPEARAAEDRALGLGELPADPHRLPRAHVEHEAGRRRRSTLFIGYEGRSASRPVLSFDALFEADARFLIDFDVEVKFKYKGKTFFGVSVSGRFTGPEPKRVEGEWSIDLWLFSISGSSTRRSATTGRRSSCRPSIRCPTWSPR